MYLQSLQKSLFLQRRNIFQWLNVIFNSVDEERRKRVGADRSCAEWLLRNGARVKWEGADEYLSDYNLLPFEGTVRYISAVDATDASLTAKGFLHFYGCNHIKRLLLVRCYDIEDEALHHVTALRGSLNYLQIQSCLNISSKGLLNLQELTNLKELILGDLPYVKDKDNVMKILNSHLAGCTIKFD